MPACANAREAIGGAVGELGLVDGFREPLLDGSLLLPYEALELPIVSNLFSTICFLLL
ncbi:MAG: hypothetical protein ABI823_07795 [Bryobacteraceae bacterium]